MLFFIERILLSGGEELINQRIDYLYTIIDALAHTATLTMTLHSYHNLLSSPPEKSCFDARGFAVRWLDDCCDMIGSILILFWVVDIACDLL